MHIWCEGEINADETVPVILFEHGWMGSSLDWSLVFHEMKSHTRVCSYDRAGYGWSEQGPLPRTAIQHM